MCCTNSWWEMIKIDKRRELSRRSECWKREVRDARLRAIDKSSNHVTWSNLMQNLRSKSQRIAKMHVIFFEENAKSLEWFAIKHYLHISNELLFAIVETFISQKNIQVRHSSTTISVSFAYNANIKYSMHSSLLWWAQVQTIFASQIEVMFVCQWSLANSMWFDLSTSATMSHSIWDLFLSSSWRDYQLRKLFVFSTQACERRCCQDDKDNVF